MNRLRLLAVLAAASLALAVPSPAAAATSERPSGVSSGDALGAFVADVGGERSLTELTARQIRRAVPKKKAFGPGTSRTNSGGDFADPCEADRLVGPLPVNAAGARYLNTEVLVRVAIEEHATAAAARQRFRAFTRQTNRACNGHTIGQFELQRRRGSSVARIGQQNWHRSYWARSPSGQIGGEYLVHIHRIGRFVILADATGGSSIDPQIERRDLRRGWRQLRNGVRDLPR